MAGPTLFPYIDKAAKAFRISRTTLWYALIGHTLSPRLAQRYFDFAGPKILAPLPLPKLPAGTRIVLPDGTDGDGIADALKGVAGQEGGDLVLITATPISPWPAVAPSRSSAPHEKRIARCRTRTNAAKERRKSRASKIK